MEAEERPTKLRKLNDGQDSSDIEQTRNCPTRTMPDQAPVAKHQTESASDIHADDLTEAHQNDDHDVQVGQLTVESDEAHKDMLPAPAAVAPSLDAVHADQSDPPLSKNQLKKLKKKAEWESKREERKVVRKEKQMAKRERKKIAKQQEAEADPEAAAEKLRLKQSQRLTQLPVTFLIDCDFDDLMRDSERISLAAQITRCYSDNKNALFRAHLTLCSFGGQLRQRFDNVLTHYKQWKGVRAFDGDFVETAEKSKEWMSAEKGGKLAGIFSKYADLDETAQAKLKDEGEIVYLTSEAEEDLLELKPYSTYIIGGLVDKNREKGICYQRATKHKVRTAKLPIGEYMEMQSRKVLATNHVNEIMVKWLECGDWGEAFMKAIPKRKGGQLKSSNGNSENNDDGEDHSDDASLPGDASEERPSEVINEASVT